MLKNRIGELKNKLVEYAILVENMIDKSMKGLSEKNASLLTEVITKDEPKANDYDIEIDELCAATIAQYEPVAGDLRTVLMIIKMNKDMERMADHVVNICESSLFLIARPPLHPLDDLTVMAATSRSMLKDAIEAFAASDVVLARAVCDRDDIVDQLGDKILKELTEIMHGAKDGIKRGLQIMRIAHNLERIADLSTNVCEEVVYIVEGKDIKHHHDHP